MYSDWIMGAFGGLMIGCAAAVFLLGNGRIMGASGILGGLFDSAEGNLRPERLAFLAGLIGVPAVIHLLDPTPAETGLTGNLALVMIAGLLVGLGTRIGNGCTSGHGVCGISRLSLRGMVATVIYISAGALTVAALRHLTGLI
ncbi:YeeE/YedE thiosulfate transporter family protein [uncultured Roseobacter sp.]|uniref:YeeE/YedE family protein n=1 Tax=uncultured Roseobacter sp. TaxID=114847 RepID=UPI0026295E56|nr:YeeE/YedE thiosulfate transporter family protein [uncultured Roseobacter sp.]